MAGTATTAIRGRFSRKPMEPLFAMDDDTTLWEGDSVPHGPALLLVSDVIVAMDLHEILTECGVAEIVICRSVSELTPDMVGRGFAVAFVDFGSHGAHELQAAALLAAAGIALVALGSLEELGLADQPVGLVVIRKPYARQQIADALRRVSAAARSGRSGMP
jgi:hypothetical protein